MHSASPLAWLNPGAPFPPLEQAWGASDPAPGLLAGGGALDVPTLQKAYSQGIFPWFSDGQPVLWWSPDPRMVLQATNFRLHRSLRKTLQAFIADPSCEIRFDSAFLQVIQACATSPRTRQSGTWILPSMVQAYTLLHQAGGAHSIETWINGELAGGLYCVAIGRAVFGESMFTRVPDASKIALAALIAFCRHHDIGMVDCQQATGHLASLGAREMPRQRFIEQVGQSIKLPGPSWQFEPVYWNTLFASRPGTT
jgi:leucyl/phenylalanyl-tRNA--protein transferase